MSDEERLLKRAGAAFIRHGKRHDLYRLGAAQIAVSRSHSGNWRSVRRLKLLIDKVTRGAA